MDMTRYFRASWFSQGARSGRDGQQNLYDMSGNAFLAYPHLATLPSLRPCPAHNPFLVRA